MNKFHLFLAIIFSIPPQMAIARSTNACFSKDEVTMMVDRRDALSQAASKCLIQYWDTHIQFHKKNNYSKYFGNQNPGLNTADKREIKLLNILWPGFAKSLSRSEYAALMSANRLNDFETYFSQENPSAYKYYYQNVYKSPGLRLAERAAEESGSADILRPNDGIKLQNISCIDMARRCLSEGFKQAGMNSTWAKIDKVVRDNDLSGVEMQKALSDLGWKVFYWNPDPSQNQAWELDEQQARPATAAHKWQGAWGGHVSRYKRVMEKGEYFLGAERPILVDDKKLLVGFGTSIPASFAAVPFFIGTAHSGYHVFPGYSGRIIEAHSSRALSGRDNLQVSTFNPLAQNSGGGPRWTDSERYRSGVIVIPPGYIESSMVMHDPQVDAQGCVELKPYRAPASKPTGAAPPSSGSTITGKTP